MKISGKQLAGKIYEHISRNILELNKKDIAPKLIIVKSIHTDAVNNYIRQKVEKGRALGINVEVFVPSNDLLNSQARCVQLINQLYTSESVHGVIFQKPGDERINKNMEEIIGPIKDVDGFLGTSIHEPPTYRGVKLILREIFSATFKEKFHTLRIVLIGKGKTGGAPIISGLLHDKVDKRNIAIIDSKTKESERKAWISKADVIISAVGKLNPVDYGLFSNKQILIDIGIHFDEANKIKGDFDEETIKDRVAYYTTTPGGLGPLTVAFLMDNVVNSALKLL